jgi:hypothetical protein
MKVRKRTPKTALAQRVIGAKALSLVKNLSEALGFPEKDIEEELVSFILVGTRVKFSKNEIDFELILPSDTQEDIERKFTAYLDSERYDSVTAAWDLIAEADAPTDEALAPTPPKESSDPKAES